MVLSSAMEGGANVISECIVAGVAVLASRIAGSIGLLGKDYPGYFQFGDTRGLAKLLERVESQPAFFEKLKRRCDALRPVFSPERERDAWKSLLDPT
jgi:hypothetical protein